MIKLMKFNEGYIKKGGVNNGKRTPRPNPPKGQAMESTISNEELDKMLADLKEDDCSVNNSKSHLILSSGDELYIKKLNLKITVI